MNQGKWGSVAVSLYACVNRGKWGSVTVSLYVWTRANGALLAYMCEPGQMGLCDCEFIYM